MLLQVGKRMLQKPVQRCHSKGLRVRGTSRCGVEVQIGQISESQGISHSILCSTVSLEHFCPQNLSPSEVTKTNWNTAINRAALEQSIRDRALKLEKI